MFSGAPCLVFSVFSTRYSLASRKKEEEKVCHCGLACRSQGCRRGAAQHRRKLPVTRTCFCGTFTGCFIVKCGSPTMQQFAFSFFTLLCFACGGWWVGRGGESERGRDTANASCHVKRRAPLLNSLLDLFDPGHARAQAETLGGGAK